MPIPDGAVFAGYTIERLLGTGGLGEVYLVRHPRLPRQEALRILPASVSADPEYRQRFAREADIAASLWHPHITAVHDRGEHGDQLWITMDYVDGTSLAQLVGDDYPRGMQVEDVVDIVSAIADALDYGHEQQLLHLDVKPSNILLTMPRNGQRRILLTDFGIARQADDANGSTATNTTFRSIDYSAPEQLVGDHLDGRADQYSLAAAAYYLLTGTAPYAHSNSAVVISRHLSTPPPQVADARPELAPLDEVLAKAMAKDPAERYGSCMEFAGALYQRADNILLVHSATPVVQPRSPAPPPVPVTAATPGADINQPAPPVTVSNWGAPTSREPPAPARPEPPPPSIAPSATHPSAFDLKWVGVILFAAAAIIAVVVLAAIVVSGDKSDPTQRPTAAPAPSTLTPWPETVNPPRTVTETAPPVTITQPTPTIVPPRRSTPPVVPPQRPATRTPAPTQNPGLGLRQPISKPMCNGQGIVILGSVTTPGKYAEGVQRLLDAHPGAFYLRTDQTCPSLRAATEEGNPIYAVFIPGGLTQPQVCATVNAAGGGAYGKWLDYTTDPGYIIPC